MRRVGDRLFRDRLHMKPAVLVTGGAGYVGSHCCRALANAGFFPVVFDNLATGHREFAKWGALEEGDIRDRARLRQIFSRYTPVAVVHCAGLTLVGESIRSPGIYYDVNVLGTLNVLQQMLRAGCQSLVFSSSCAVYGDVSTRTIDEGMPLVPTNPYGETKLVCERMMDDFGRASGLRSLRLRYFNAAGAARDAPIGEWHDPETHLVPLVLDAALGRRGAVTVFGSDYPTPDGTAVRDYVHVDDLASAHVRAVEYLLGGGQTDAVNLGSGRGTSVLEILRAAQACVGRSIRHHFGDRRVGDSPILVADNAKARRVLGWKPRRSENGRIIADAWAWHGAAFGSGADSASAKPRDVSLRPSPALSPGIDECGDRTSSVPIAAGR